MAEAHATEWLLSDHAGFWATSVSPLKKTLTTNVMSVVRCSAVEQPSSVISSSILERNLTNVISVAKALVTNNVFEFITDCIMNKWK